MPIRDQIIGSKEDVAEVDGDVSALRVIMVPAPPKIPQRVVPLRQFFADVNGSNDMQVNASVSAPQDFYIDAHPTRDTYIKSINFVIADGGATANQFGNIGALTNGVQIFYTNPLIGEVFVAEALQTNFDFLQLAKGEPAFGTANNAFRLNNVQGNSEAFIPSISLQDFSPDDGIKLDAGTTQRLTIRVRDNTTGVDRFDCVAFGFQRI